MEQIFKKTKLPTEILVFLNTLLWSAFPLKNAPSGLLLCGYLIQELARVMEKNRKRRDEHHLVFVESKLCLLSKHCEIVDNEGLRKVP